jgi:hypothetical protein
MVSLVLDYRNKLVAVKTAPALISISVVNPIRLLWQREQRERG